MPTVSSRFVGTNNSICDSWWINKLNNMVSTNMERVSKTKVSVHTSLDDCFQAHIVWILESIKQAFCSLLPPYLIFVPNHLTQGISPCNCHLSHSHGFAKTLHLLYSALNGSPLLCYVCGDLVVVVGRLCWGDGGILVMVLGGGMVVVVWWWLW